jgi:hypothetical protein
MIADADAVTIHGFLAKLAVIERIIRENHPCPEAEDRAVMRLRSNAKQLIG